MQFVKELRICFCEYLMIQQMIEVEIGCGDRLLIQEFRKNVEKNFECKKCWGESRIGFGSSFFGSLYVR